MRYSPTRAQVDEARAAAAAAVFYGLRVNTPATTYAKAVEAVLKRHGDDMLLWVMDTWCQLIGHYSDDYNAPFDALIERYKNAPPEDGFGLALRHGEPPARALTSALAVVSRTDPARGHLSAEAIYISTTDQGTVPLHATVAVLHAAACHAVASHGPEVVERFRAIARTEVTRTLGHGVISDD